MNKVVKNIGVLDVREAGQEVLNQLNTISNIGTYITNDQVESMMMHISKENIGSVVKYDGKIENLMVNGKTVITKDTFVSDAKYIVAVNGKCYIEKDVDLSQLKDTILSCAINGKLYVPSHLSAAKSKFHVNGQVVEYNSEMTLVDATVTLTNEYLESYFGDSMIAVENLVAIEPIDVDLLSEELEKIQVLNRLFVTKSNAKKMKSLIQVNQNNIKIIPENVHYVHDNAKFDEALVYGANKKDIYVNGKLSFNDITMIEKLGEQKIFAEEIRCKEEHIALIKPFCLKESQVFKSNKNKGLSNYDKLTIDKLYLESLTKDGVLGNYGELIVDEDVIDCELKVNFSIDNYGTIKVNSETKPWVLSKLNENYGTLKVEGAVEAKYEMELFANMGFLKL